MTIFSLIFVVVLTSTAKDGRISQVSVDQQRKEKNNFLLIKVRKFHFLVFTGIHPNQTFFQFKFFVFLKEAHRKDQNQVQVNSLMVNEKKIQYDEWKAYFFMRKYRVYGEVYISHFPVKVVLFTMPLRHAVVHFGNVLFCLPKHSLILLLILLSIPTFLFVFSVIQPYPLIVGWLLLTLTFLTFPHLLFSSSSIIIPSNFPLLFLFILLPFFISLFILFIPCSISFIFFPSWI